MSVVHQSKFHLIIISIKNSTFWNRHLKLTNNSMNIGCWWKVRCGWKEFSKKPVESLNHKVLRPNSNANKLFRRKQKSMKLHIVAKYNTNSMKALNGVLFCFIVIHRIASPLIPVDELIKKCFPHTFEFPYGYLM